MTTIDIRLIRPSPNPIRKTWDEDKMQELAASIKERGVIVPIKVRPIDYRNLTQVDDGSVTGRAGRVLGTSVEPAGYEIVYGHRRVEAARRAGLEEIPAIVEGLEDWTALLQQIIENEVRTDVIIDERAAGYRSALNHPMNPKPGSVHYLATSTGVPISRIRESLTYLEQIEEGVVGSNNSAGDASIRQVIELKSILGDDTDSKRAVYEKHKSEELNWRETRAVAEAYKAADTPELRDAVLNTSGKLGDADRILQVAQMNIGAAGLVERNEQERRQAFEDYDRAVKDFLDAMKLFDRMLKTARDAARYGKFSPEGARFAVGRIDKLIDELETLKETLSNVE